MQIAIIGTGSVGAALAGACTRAGHTVVFGTNPVADGLRGLQTAGERARPRADR